MDDGQILFPPRHSLHPISPKRFIYNFMCCFYRTRSLLLPKKSEIASIRFNNVPRQVATQDCDDSHDSSVQFRHVTLPASYGT